MGSCFFRGHSCSCSRATQLFSARHASVVQKSDTFLNACRGLPGWDRVGRSGRGTVSGVSVGRGFKKHGLLRRSSAQRGSRGTLRGRSLRKLPGGRRPGDPGSQVCRTIGTAEGSSRLLLRGSAAEPRKSGRCPLLSPRLPATPERWALGVTGRLDRRAFWVPACGKADSNSVRKMPVRSHLSRGNADAPGARPHGPPANAETNVHALVAPWRLPHLEVATRPRVPFAKQKLLFMKLISGLTARVSVYGRSSARRHPGNGLGPGRCAFSPGVPPPQAACGLGGDP